MKKTIIALLLLIAYCFLAFSQQIPLPQDLPQGYPRLMTTENDKPQLADQIKKEAWAQEVYQGILQRIDPYVGKTQTEPDWVYSRLMMYWKSKATQVYINGGIYSHADGEAPVPTVRFGSTRGVYSSIKRPKLEDIIPYMDDTKGIYFHNSAKEGNPLEWVDQANVSGNSIENVNEEIIRLAKDAAFIYWLTGEERYAKFAFDIFDTYMMGMYYRTEPIDIGNGHAQTLTGLSTFEVIQERILDELAYTYDFLYSYISSQQPGNSDKYAVTFKKWIDITIKNGVPHNNWNLHGGKHILKVAMVLEDNRHYADGKGREYYIDYILNKTSARQWSLTKFMKYGYDYTNGVWNECPGYAQGVTRELMSFIRDYDNTFNQNLLPYAPVMEKAVRVLPQYLFPNGKITAFGDTYYSVIQTEAISDIIHIAQKYNDRRLETDFTRMYKLFAPHLTYEARQEHKLPPQISSFFSSKPITLDPEVAAGELKEYITPTFYAPNVSWFVQRNAFDDPRNGMMISQFASYGNHAHSNGLAMELYGKGYILGAESGIGSSYFEKPYLEYYSQFPAHNTVMVDGISKYPEMLSNHPFDLLGSYPRSGQSEGYYPGITYSEAYFLEPESRSDQNRLMSIVRTGETTGYYVDIFRSKKQRGGEKFHDYFYHNLGQELFIQDRNGKALDLQPNDEMAFAGGHLFALDYMWDKRSAKTATDYQATWKMAMPDSNHVYMHLWMKGYTGREVFSIKAPPCKAFRSNDEFPYEVNKEPYLTIAARQHGEAWKRPFVSVFEPATESEGRSITSIEAFEVPNASDDFVGLTVKSRDGKVDYIFSSIEDENIHHRGITVQATYGLVREDGKDFTLFMGNGTLIQAKGCKLETASPANVVLEYKNGSYYLHCEQPVEIEFPGKGKVKYEATAYKQISR
ncbi:hypothetical protein [Parabacteroides sp. PF5-6]|uniref:hypothetical protein n=1 Tax=Parabacteroides sp. PF5-6 TaxID=1742403 RepID=UPI00240673EF|nr:hypothetical protein [Parabacteroides sp. PF5-6]MDF9829784.1 hypothetical protein [Parabacteroides sp. PF5-6]